jgi:hypothetical protein
MRQKHSWPGPRNAIALTRFPSSRSPHVPYEAAAADHTIRRRRRPATQVASTDGQEKERSVVSMEEEALGLAPSPAETKVARVPAWGTADSWSRH